MPNEELREKNRKEVLSQAIACFIEKGIEASTLNMIASRSGVTTRSILRYFHSKENLVGIVIAEILSSMYAPMKELFDSEEYINLTGMEQLMSMFDLRARYARENTYRILCLTELEIYFTKRMQDAKLYRQYYDCLHFLSASIEAAVRKGIEDGTVKKDIDIKMASDFMAIACKGLVQRMSLIFANRVLVKEYDPDMLIYSFRGMIAGMLKP